MQCRCGGEAKLTDSVNNKLKAVFDYYECRACGRASAYQLLIDNILVATGPLASQHYALLDKALAEDLLAGAQETPKAEAALAEPEPVITTPLHQQNIELFETGSLF